MGQSRRLQMQILRLVLSAAAVSSVVAGGLAYFVGHKSVEQSTRQSVKEMVAAIEKTAAIGTYARDKVLLREIIDGLVRNALVARVEILSTDGELLQSSSATSDARAMGTGSLHLLPTNWLAVDLVPPFRDAEVVGRLYIELDVAHIESIARKQAGTLAIAMVGQTVLVALVLYLGAASMVSRPIEDLARGLRSMLPGTANRLLAPSAHQQDEIGTLAAAANGLLQANEDALQRERRLRTELEEMATQHRHLQDLVCAGAFVLDHRGVLLSGTRLLPRILGASEAGLEALLGREIAGQFRHPELLMAMIDELSHVSGTRSADLEVNGPDGGAVTVHLRLATRVHESGERNEGRFDGVVFEKTVA